MHPSAVSFPEGEQRGASGSGTSYLGEESWNKDRGW